MKENKLLLRIVGGIVLGGAVFIGIVLLSSDKDVNKTKYKEIMANIDNMEYFHVIQTRELLHSDGIKSYESSEIYANGERFTKSEEVDLINATYHTSETIVQLSNDEMYSIYVGEEGETKKLKDAGVAWLFSNITYYNDLFNFWVDKNLSYEGDNGWIVSYDAQNLIGQRVRNGNYSDSTYKTALSVCYFDNNWNLKRIELTEVFDVIDENETQEYTQKTVIEFVDTSQEDVDKKIDEEYAKIQKEF